MQNILGQARFGQQGKTVVKLPQPATKQMACPATYHNGDETTMANATRLPDFQPHMGQQLEKWRIALFNLPGT